MITNLKIKAKQVKTVPNEQLLKNLEAGKTITGLNIGERYEFKLEMTTDIETAKKVVEYVQELGKSGSQGK